MLSKHYEDLKLTPSQCLVPLCGKAVDMRWLFEQGHAVTGIDLRNCH